MMSSEPPAGELKPITPARIAQELTKLTAARRSGEFTPAAYDQRFARMVRELNERRIDGVVLPRDRRRSALRR